MCAPCGGGRHSCPGARVFCCPLRLTISRLLLGSVTISHLLLDPSTNFRLLLTWLGSLTTGHLFKLRSPLPLPLFCLVTVSAQGFAQDNLQNSAFRFFGEVSRLRNVWLECAQS